MVLKKEFMKQYTYFLLVAITLATMLTSCELVEGIFKAGFYAAFLLIIVVVGLIIWLVSRFRK